MAGGTGTSSRGRGGKFKKYTRGGGKHFSRDIRPTDADGNEVSMWSVDSKKEDDDDDDDDSDEDSESEEDSEEEDSEEDGPSQAQAQEASREDRKAQKKARKEAAIAKQSAKTVEVGDLPSSDEDSDEDEDDDMPANPNHSKAARNQANNPGVDDITEGVSNMAAPSRREREAIEAAAAKEKHMRLAAQGKTDEAKADLARLRLIREQREAEAARRQAEKEEREEQEKKKKAEFEAKEARKKDVKKGKKK